MLLWDEIVGTTWELALAHVKQDIALIDEFLMLAESEGQIIYPLRGKRFLALRLTPVNLIKCVIVGQDPYPGASNGDPFAMGLAFSVPAHLPLPASLRNINAEIKNAGGNGLISGDLEHWAKQGVLLLNAVLTLKSGESLSHSKIGWQKITNAILFATLKNKPHPIYLGFGRPAHKLYKECGVPEAYQIKTSHPSPLGAYKHSVDGSFIAFTGSNCFNKINEFLLAQQREKIEWSHF